jgi:hypothetical protein
MAENFSWPEPSPRTRPEALAFAVSSAQARGNPIAAERVGAALDSIFTIDNGLFAVEGVGLVGSSVAG